MTARTVIRGLNLSPLDSQHRGSNAARAARREGDVALNIEQLEDSFEHEFAVISRYYDQNAAAYQNRRTHLRQNPTALRIISSIGIDALYPLGWRRRGRGAPVFRYFPPKTNEGIRPFRGGPSDIRHVVMHSFGRGFDAGVIRRERVRSPAIDPETGHNPRRFMNGLNTLLSPTVTARAAVHHMVSLRGDLINSVSWDNRSIHGGDGRRPPSRLEVAGVNDYTIGIEHEEWYVVPTPGANIREIQDHGPFTEEQYAVDAFILKKLQAYTGYDYRRYIGGPTNTVREYIRNEVPGCFNHASTSGHADPGGEFFLPPGFELGVTSLSSVPDPLVSGRPGAWQERFEIWWNDVPRGTKISAYDRIFEKVGRLRSFNLQTEVFDPSIGGGRIQVTPPTVRSTHAIAAAERAARDRIASVERSERMQGVTRAGLYSAAQDTNSAIATAWAEHTGRLSQITERSLRLPVIINAVGFDFSTGMWVNQTSRNEPTTEQIEERVARINTPTTPNVDPPADT